MHTESTSCLVILGQLSAQSVVVTFLIMKPNIFITAICIAKSALSRNIANFCLLRAVTGDVLHSRTPGSRESVQRNV